MRSATEIGDYVVEGISDVYQRPRMFSLTADGVELALHLYHDLWAFIMQRETAYREASSAIRSEEFAAVALFSNNFAMAHPDSSEAERVEYAIGRWKKIDRLLGLDVARPSTVE